MWIKRQNGTAPESRDKTTVKTSIYADTRISINFICAYNQFERKKRNALTAILRAHVRDRNRERFSVLMATNDGATRYRSVDFRKQTRYMLLYSIEYKRIFKCQN